MTAPDPTTAIRAALDRSAKQFRWYEQLHSASSDFSKAAANATMAIVNELALTVLEQLEASCLPRLPDGWRYREIQNFEHEAGAPAWRVWI